MPDVNTEVTISTLCHKVVELEADIGKLKRELMLAHEKLDLADQRSAATRAKAIDLANLVEGASREMNFRIAGKLRSEF
jgi:hypothetical protein